MRHEDSAENINIYNEGWNDRGDEMRHYDSIFFCEEPIYAHVRKAGEYFPVTLMINGSIDKSHDAPRITFHMKNTQDLIAFKNSVIGAVDAIEKRGA